MNVLVGCEYSGTVRRAFEALGHSAISCDLLSADDGSNNHYQGDISTLLDSGLPFGIIILHPPCTALTVAGNSTYGEGQPKYAARLKSAEWTAKLWRKACSVAQIGVCMENPVGVLPRLAGLYPAQYVQPWMFGHMEQKKTGLWLDRLPPLKPTNDVYEAMMLLPKNQRERLHYLPPSADRWKIRSTTFQGIAAAMAAQWGHL